MYMYVHIYENPWVGNQLSRMNPEVFGCWLLCPRNCYHQFCKMSSFSAWTHDMKWPTPLHHIPSIFHFYSYIYVWMNHQKWLYIYIYILKKKNVVLLSICQFVTSISDQTRDWTAFWHRPMAVPPRHGRHAPEQRRSPIAAGGAPEQHLAPAVAPPALEPASPRAAGTWRPGRPGGTFLYLTGCNHQCESILSTTSA